ncbi:MAG: rhomboid family intramembrane serine protease [Anaerolineae bacterium]|jgi:rhomboid protease GluP|nr:rhomboid family intramembrane serine protease [Anaerolineae bacterium]
MVYEDSTPVAPPQVLQLPLARIRAIYPLIVVNVLAFIPYLSMHLNLEGIWYLTLGLGGLIPSAVLDYYQLWRLITAGFLHADYLHIALNMYALHNIGRDAERLFGTGRFLLSYLLSLLSGSILVTALAGRETGTIGASGAIMGIVGMLLIYSKNYREVPAVNEMFGSMLRMALLNLGIGLLPGISLWGHLGGLLGGLAAGWAFCPRYQIIAGTEWSPARITLEPWGTREMQRLGLVTAGLVAALALTLWVR